MRITLLSAMLILPSVGCLQIEKTGPIWGKSGKDAGPTRSKVDPKAVIMAPRDAEPVAQEGGPRPPSPTFSVTPNEIDSTNAHASAARLREEMQHDLNAPFPAYPVVSNRRR